MEMARVKVKGTIVPNDDKWIYDWFGIEAVCPRDIERAIAEAKGEMLSVEVNSGGGDVFAGNEIYYLLAQYPGETVADITGFAGSAATIICCGADRVRAVPGALYMIHNVSGSAQGDHRAMTKKADVLKTANQSISNIYRMKTGMEDAELLALMEKESWMDAREAREKGFIDEIIGDTGRIYNACYATVLSPEVLDKIRNTVTHQDETDPDFFMQRNKLELLKLKGEMRNEI